jgi:hypothetical protein
MDANDEVVVVFGGSSGIGEAVARTMAARGSRVVIAGRDPGRLAAAAGRVGRAVQTAAVDAGDRDAVMPSSPACPPMLITWCCPSAPAAPAARSGTCPWPTSLRRSTES